MLNLKARGVAVGAALLLATAAHAATTNGIANGGFESPAGAGQIAASWLTAATGSPASLSTDAHSGSFALRLSANAFDASVALQNSVGHGNLPALDASNVGDTPLLSFWAKGFAGVTGNAWVKLEYMGANGAILSTPLDQQFQTLLKPSEWTLVSFEAAAIPVGATALYLQIGNSLGPLLGTTPHAVLVDDIQLTLTTAPVPEPGTYALLAGGLAVIGMAARRRRA